MLTWAGARSVASVEACWLAARAGAAIRVVRAATRASLLLIDMVFLHSQRDDGTECPRLKRFDLGFGGCALVAADRLEILGLRLDVQRRPLHAHATLSLLGGRISAG